MFLFVQLCQFNIDFLCVSQRKYVLLIMLSHFFQYLYKINKRSLIMIASQSALKLPQTFCQVHSAKIVHICTNKSCSDKPLVCVPCIQGPHQGHPTVSLQDFAQKIGNLRYQQHLPNKIAFFETIIKQNRTALLKSLTDLHNKLKYELDQVERTITQWADNQIGILKKTSEIYVNCRSQLPVGRCEGSLRELVEKYNRCVEVQKNAEIHIDRQMNKVLEDVGAKNYILETTAIRLVDVMKQSFGIFSVQIPSKIVSVNIPEPRVLPPSHHHPHSHSLNLQNTQSNDFQPPKWSKNLKNPDIEISNKIAKRNQQVNHYSSVCGLVQKINLNAWKVKFKIVRCKGTLYIGMCLKGIIVRSEFKYEGFGTSNHGHYVLEKQGEVQTHTGKKPKYRFAFREGEVISVEYDSNKGSLVFEKNKDERIVLEVPRPPKDDCFYPCVYLGTVNDSVQLL